MTNSKLVHADQNLVIEFNETVTQSELRAKSIELGAPIGKTSLSNLLNGKVEQTGGWSLVAAVAAKEGHADTAKTTPDAPSAPINDAPALTLVVTPTVAPVVEEAPVVVTAPVAAPAPAAAAPVVQPKPAAAAKASAVRFEKDASIKALMELNSYEPVLKEAPTETYVTLKLAKARIQATIGVRGVTLMLFPLKGLVLQEIDAVATGWNVKSQYAKVGVFAPEAVAAQLVVIEEVIAKLV